MQDQNLTKRDSTQICSKKFKIRTKQNKTTWKWKRDEITAVTLVYWHLKLQFYGISQACTIKTVRVYNVRTEEERVRGKRTAAETGVVRETAEKKRERWDGVVRERAEKEREEWDNEKAEKQREERQNEREERRLGLGFEEKIAHVAFMHCNMCQLFEEKCAHMTLIDWDTC
jgi:CRISPR/Cas system CSM-associated protein Csm5 (group 7 of RAMP superfamily)